MGLAVATAFVLTCVNFVLAVDARRANFMYFGVVVVGLAPALRVTSGRSFDSRRPQARTRPP